jgi:hypothetical protein
MAKTPLLTEVFGFGKKAQPAPQAQQQQAAPQSQEISQAQFKDAFQALAALKDAWEQYDPQAQDQNMRRAWTMAKDALQALMNKSWGTPQEHAKSLNQAVQLLAQSSIPELAGEVTRLRATLGHLSKKVG